MNIVADVDLYRVEDYFGELGNLRLFPGREIEPKHLSDVDALIVRSITPVSLELLRNSSIKFVGTATSGTDHIDKCILNSSEIYCAHAKGSNANAVVDYVFAVLAEMGVLESEVFSGKSFGIVGCGAIGSRLAEILLMLGAKVKINDPPLQLKQEYPLQDRDLGFSSLEETLAADVVSIHTPLIREGSEATENLISTAEFNLMPEDGLLIHSCRGGVVNESAAIEKKLKHNDFKLAFDVWSTEPGIDQEIAKRVDLGTPHIAGYSHEAKESAVSMIRTQFLNFFDLAAVVPEIDANDQTATAQIPVNAHNLNELFSESISIRNLSDELKRALEENRTEAYFDSARKVLVSRREFKSLLTDYSGAPDFEKMLLGLLGVKQHSKG